MFENNQEAEEAIEGLNKAGLQASFARVGQVNYTHKRLFTVKLTLIVRNPSAHDFDIYKMKPQLIFTFLIYLWIQLNKYEARKKKK